MDKTNQPLRFALLTRASTSTPEQEKEGYSLERQEQTLRQHVSQLGGVIPPDCIYAGQEHTATARTDRKILNRLLDDAKKDKFDAVMIDDISRIGRDSELSKKVRRTLFVHNIDLYEGQKLLDWTNPASKFSTNIRAEVAVAQLLAEETALKSIKSKILLANRGWPTNDTKTWGRYITNIDKTDPRKTNKNVTAEWVIDPEIQRITLEAYHLYMYEGWNFRKLGEKYGIATTSMRRNLVENTGGTFIQKD